MGTTKKTRSFYVGLSKRFNRFSKKPQSVFLWVGVFAVVGGLTLIFTHAASFVAAFEAENATPGGVSSVTDPSASNGRAIVFGHNAGGGCGLPGAVFCDTFDLPAGIGNRAGELNGNIWGVSRAIGLVNFGGSAYNQWPQTTLQKCDGSTPKVYPPNDVIICNGQLREASNDNPSGQFDAGTVTTLAMYPKQPFDFAGRTGTVAFDVSNDTHGNHGAWPEFWLSDLPVPTPFNHFDSWQALPQHGFGIRFAGSANPGEFGICPNSNNLNHRRWTVDSAVVVRNWVMEDVNFGGGGYNVGNMRVTPLDCVIRPDDNSGVLNHVELKISQNQIDVYATDAGTTSPLRHIAVISNANLSATRGLIWLEDVHYNADKADPPSQREHTFVWDNVAFDGPFTYRDMSYDAPDALTPGQPGTVNLGKFASANQTTSWTVAGLPANRQAAAVRVLFNFHGEVHPPWTSLTVSVNGHPHSVGWPYPDQLQNTWRTMAVTIPISDLVTGNNTVTIGANQPLVVSNVNIVLVNVPQ